ncbi:MAG: two-component system, OmpR family, sensor kinase [Desulfovibrionales bacterium]|nr:two-component system, OmpR family, sensor kinase [Desulfovibrionales bacterium]
MTVRLKITVLITAAGFVASLVFSCTILWEMMEQPFRLIDSDLESTGLRIARIAAEGGEGGNSTSWSMGDMNYWLEVKDQTSGAVCYRSRWARLFRIPAPSVDRSVTVAVDVPPQAPLGKDAHGKVAFRIRTLAFSLNGNPYLVTVGRPMEHLEEELRDTVVGAAGGLAFSVLLLAGISYFLAGFMLKPIREINAQARDISEKHLDRRLPTTGDHDEFDSLAETLNHVFDRLQHAFLRQKRLLADASHELKTPLTMMRLALDEIRSGASESRPDPQAENHARMTEQALRMERLVKSLLDLSALEIEASASRVAMDLTPILDSLIDDYRFLGDASGVTLQADLPKRLEMDGDPEKLTRAFSNLLDNAIKYNMEGGSVTITGVQSDAEVSISVTNTGPGAPEADIPRIFEQFYRVEKSRSQRHGGSGLGLTIVKRIVELHGGTVTFRNIPGDRTEVTVILPRRGVSLGGGEQDG